MALATGPVPVGCYGNMLIVSIKGKRSSLIRGVALIFTSCVNGCCRLCLCNDAYYTGEIIKSFKYCTNETANHIKIITEALGVCDFLARLW